MAMNHVTVHQLYTGSQLRNFTYIVESSHKHLYIIDPWDGAEVLAFASDHSGLIKGIINTHEHWDHTKGNEEIVKKTQCAVYTHPRGKGKVPEANCFPEEGDKIKISDKAYFEILDTPGHTFAHLCFVLVEEGNPLGIFTGDTLFNAGVGNCHNGGDPEVLFETIQSKFGALSDDLIVYPGHEYLGNNLKFTLDREPSNLKAKEWLETYQSINWEKSPVTTTLKDEKEINTFFRLGQKEIRERLPGEPQTDKETFLKLRSKRNDW